MAYSHVLVVHAAIKCEQRELVTGKACLSPYATYSFELTADFMEVSQGLPWDPESRKKGRLLWSGQKIDRGSKFKVIA